MLRGRDNPLVPAGNRTPAVQPQPVGILTELSRTHYVIIMPFKYVENQINIKLPYSIA
jgi:hypothetical protein